MLKPREKSAAIRVAHHNAAFQVHACLSQHTISPQPRIVIIDNPALRRSCARPPLYSADSVRPFAPRSTFRCVSKEWRTRTKEKKAVCLRLRYSASRPSVVHTPQVRFAASTVIGYVVVIHFIPASGVAGIIWRATSRAMACVCAEVTFAMCACRDDYVAPVHCGCSYQE